MRIIVAGAFIKMAKQVHFLPNQVSGSHRTLEEFRSPKQEQLWIRAGVPFNNWVMDYLLRKIPLETSGDLWQSRVKAFVTMGREVVEMIRMLALSILRKQDFDSEVFQAQYYGCVLSALGIVSPRAALDKFCSYTQDPQHKILCKLQ